jgi:hypothetical protein
VVSLLFLVLCLVSLLVFIFLCYFFFLSPWSICLVFVLLSKPASWISLPVTDLPTSWAAEVMLLDTPLSHILLSNQNEPLCSSFVCFLLPRCLVTFCCCSLFLLPPLHQIKLHLLDSASWTCFQLICCLKLCCPMLWSGSLLFLL